MRSVRFRLTVWYAVLLLAALALFSGMIWLSLRHRLLRELDEEVTASASRFRTYFLKEIASQRPEQITDELEEYCQALPPSTYLQLRGSGGYEFHYPARFREGRGKATETELRFTARGDSWTLRTGGSSAQIDHTLELLRLLLLSLIPAVVGVACLGGAWLSRRALGPVDEITTAAKKIGIENLTERLPVPATGDELQRLTEGWNTMLGRLDAAVKTLSQFAADASHELRTPLAVIRTGAELALRRERSPEAYRESLREIGAEAERMTRLVEDLLFLARSETKNAGMPMEQLELGSILREVIHELQDLAGTRGIRLQLNARPAMVSGNRTALRRLFLAIIDNAVKYSPPGGAVAVELRGGSVEIRDQGMGIAAGELPNIFQRFYRADTARANGAGYGLGLSLASAIAAAHGGNITAESVEGAGACFRVSIPER